MKSKTEGEFETNIKGIARYLGCNEDELYSEMRKYFQEIEGRILNELYISDTEIDEEKHLGEWCINEERKRLKKVVDKIFNL